MRSKICIVCVLTLLLGVIGGCLKDNRIDADDNRYEVQEDGSVWIYPAGPEYVDKNVGVVLTLPEDYWENIILYHPEDSTLNIYYREVKENEPLLTNGAILATILYVDRNSELDNGWAEAVGTEFFAQTKTRNYYTAVWARDILSPVSDREMLEQMTRTFEENLEEIFTFIDE